MKRNPVILNIFFAIALLAAQDSIAQSGAAPFRTLPPAKQFHSLSATIQWGDFADTKAICQKTIVTLSRGRKKLKNSAPVEFQIIALRSTSKLDGLEVGDVNIIIFDDVLRGYNVSGASQEVVYSSDGEPPTFLFRYDREINEMVLNYRGKSYACQFVD
jgi:hypothetical protein